jgi:hypothetical protein
MQARQLHFVIELSGVSYPQAAAHANGIAYGQRRSLQHFFRLLLRDLQMLSRGNQAVDETEPVRW